MILSINPADFMVKASLPQLKKNTVKEETDVLPASNPVSEELRGIPKSYISFMANKEIAGLSFTDDALALYNDAKAIAEKNGNTEIDPAHIIQAAIKQTDENLKYYDNNSDSGTIESVSTLNRLVDNYTKTNMLLSKNSREYMDELIDSIRNDNEEYLIELPKDTAENEEIKLSGDFERTIGELKEKTNKVDSYMLLGLAFNTLIARGAAYPQEFLKAALSYSRYKTSDDVNKNYMKVYNNRALEVWDKLALGSNLNVTYENPKEADRIIASLLKTINADKHGNYNSKNTRLYVISDDVKDSELLEEVLVQKEVNPDEQKIFLVNLDKLLGNSVDNKGGINYAENVNPLVCSTDDKTKFIFFESNDVYYRVVKEPELGFIFDGFLTYAIPPIQTYEAQSLLNKKLLEDVKIPFSRDAKSRVIYHAGNMKGIFPDKAVDLMKRISVYYGDTKKKITSEDVDEFAQIAHELFNGSKNSSDIVYDTGRTLASMYGKETTKKDIEAIIRQIKTGKIGTKGLLIYSKDPEAGSGRKYTAETIAGEAKVPFISINTSDFAKYERDENGTATESPKSAMSKVFSEAKKAARQNQYKTAIVFINNFEEFAFSGPYLPGYKQAMGQLTDEMQKAVDEDVSILVIGSTDEYYVDAIPTVVRGFNQHITVDSPAFNKKSRREILENKIRETNLPLVAKKPEEKEYLMKKLVKLTEYMSFVEIKSLVEKAQQIMYERSKDRASIGDFIEAYLQMETGRTSHPEMPEYNKQATTSHECGHATNLEVMNDLLKRRGKPWHQSHNVNFITLDPRGNFLGAVFENRDDNMDFPFEAMFTSLVCSFGGYSCEKLFFGMDGSSGISQDLAQASALVKRGIEYFGFGHHTGKISNAASIKSGNYNELVYKDMDIILKNAQLASDLITECYKNFNKWFTQKFSKLIGTDDCMVDGDEFRKSLSNWKTTLQPSQKEEIGIMEDMIMEIIDSSKKGKIYGKLRETVKKAAH